MEADLGRFIQTGEPTVEADSRLTVTAYRHSSWRYSWGYSWTWN